MVPSPNPAVSATYQSSAHAIPVRLVMLTRAFSVPGSSKSEQAAAEVVVADAEICSVGKLTKPGEVPSSCTAVGTESGSQPPPPWVTLVRTALAGETAIAASTAAPAR